jgi:hypothetical protein
MTTDTKPSNPKDIIGSTKLDLGLVPDTIDAEVALAYLEGALKYGRYNWRIAGVRASIYNAALRRHLKRWWNGENRDKVTRVKHLANLIACAGIVLDAELAGKLEDDRPPALDLDDVLEVQEHIAHLKALFADHSPKQYTIADIISHENVEPTPTIATEKTADSAAPNPRKPRGRKLVSRATPKRRK